ncbi:MAG: hypothetical protein KJ904_16415 [Alphaproteobacteria bacterium]|nr:hypothetical protein [Alphaproteobacteria bacterium]MBU0798485.1 hypothetical protein [Alphaproteobacteria bacterium]MBU0888739.1 hypothetical protein [Alphaproteobacteria bacterium]MBU1812542.1 hypothetical protein [Alphaproteobacteria bacterium]
MTALPPAILVRSLADAQLALGIAAGQPVTLLSPPEAAARMGAAYWQALVEAAVEAHPGSSCRDLLDCGAAPGHVLAALRQGLTGLIFTGSTSQRDTLRAIAEGQGAVLLDSRPEAFDPVNRRNPEADCRVWLAEMTAHPR